MKLSVFLLTLSLFGTGPAGTAVDTTRAPSHPRATPVKASKGAVKQQPRKSAKPVGDPILKRRRPPM